MFCCTHITLLLLGKVHDFRKIYNVHFTMLYAGTRNMFLPGGIISIDDVLLAVDLLQYVTPFFYVTDMYTTHIVYTVFHYCFVWCELLLLYNF